MKITIVLGAFLPVPPIMGGAIEKVWCALSQVFAQQGHEVLMISRALPHLAVSENIGGVQYRRVKGFNAPRSIVWLKFLDLIYSARVRSILPAADLIVTHTFWLPILLRDARHGKIFVQVGRVPKGQYRFYRHVHGFRTGTEAIARAVAAEVPALQQKICVIPNPALGSVNGTSPPPLSERGQTLLFVGRIHPEKGAHLLLEALATISAKSVPGWRLIIIGPTEARFGGGGAHYAARLRELAKEAAMPVEFRGAVFEPVALEREFRAARIFVYPSLAERGETFGLAPLEAMAHGCAVLVSALECFRDFVCDNESGCVFDHRAADSAQLLGRKICELIANENLAERVADGGRRKAAEFSVNHVAARFLQEFEKLR